MPHTQDRHALIYDWRFVYCKAGSWLSLVVVGSAAPLGMEGGEDLAVSRRGWGRGLALAKTESRGLASGAHSLRCCNGRFWSRIRELSNAGRQWRQIAPKNQVQCPIGKDTHSLRDPGQITVRVGIRSVPLSST